MPDRERSPAPGPTLSGVSVRIFLSYARGDDEPFVARLHADLIARGFDIWWDRVSMPARGLTFLHEIRDAIDARERFLLVIGPKATTSDYVIAEWQHAVTFGKAINPILRLGDFPIVPDELKLLHIEDFRDNVWHASSPANSAQASPDGDFSALGPVGPSPSYAFHLDNLVRQLHEPVAPMGKLVGLPSLPRHLLARPGPLQSLKDAILAELRRPVVVTGVAAFVGVHGMGGTGKSVLVNLLARDTEVRRAFPDGIFWVQLGTNPNLVELQRNISRTLGDPGYFDNVRQGCAKLSELLASKAVLLLLDDMWQRDHAEAFNVLGPRCRAIITTRDAGLVTSLGGTQYQVQLLSETESLHLLADAAEVNLTELPPTAKEIVAECGCLPLALALCAGMVKRGLYWTGILQRLKQTALESISDRNAENAQHRSLWVAMKISVDALTQDDQRRFVELSVFPSDESVPEAAVLTLWSHTGKLDEFLCEDLLLSLSERSLIRIDTDTPQAGQPPRHRVSLHQLLHDFATRLAGDAASLHGQLLDAYRKLCLNDWPSGPNDGYYFKHLRDHLVAAEHTEDLLRLALDIRWLEVKSQAGMVFDLRFDFDAAIETSSPDDPSTRLVWLIDECLSNDIQFVHRHPTTLFQCLWNLGWWYDSAEAENHFEPPENGWDHAMPPWAKPGPRLYTLLERWRDIKEVQGAGFVWLRSLRPLSSPLGSGQILCNRGHTKDVNSVAISSDGSRIVSGSSDQTIRIWNARTGEELRCLRLDGDENIVNSVAISADGSRIVSGSSDQTIRVWDATTGEELRRLRGHEKGVNSVTISTDDSRIVSGSSDQTIRVWNAMTGEELRSLRLDGEKSVVNRVAVSIDGSRIVSGSSDKTIRIWNATTGEEVRCLRGHEENVNSVAISTDGSRIVSGSSDRTIRIWNATTGEELRRLHGHEKSVNSVAISTDGSRIVSGSEETTVRIWDSVTGLEMARFALHSWRVHCVAISTDAERVVSCSRDLTVRVWRATAKPEFIWSPKGRGQSQVRCLGISPSDRVVVGYHFWDNATRVWDGTTGRYLGSIQGPGIGNTNQIAFTRNGDNVGVVVGWSEHTQFIDEKNLSAHGEIEEPIRALGLNLITPPERPLRSRSGELETAIENIAIKRDVAWFSFSLNNVSCNDSCRLWAGSSEGDTYVAIFALEGTLLRQNG